MDKPTGNGMVLTARDIQIIETVADCGALTGDQIRRHHGFGSVGRTNATLLRLTRHRYLIRRFQPTLVGTRRPVYLVGTGAKELLTGRRKRSELRTVSDLFLSHRLAVNEIRFAFEDCRTSSYQFRRWTSEDALRDHRLTVLPDAYTEYTLDGAGYNAFIEVDRSTEGLPRWDTKTQGYLDLAFSGVFRRVFGHSFFRVLVLAPDHSRVEALRNRIGKVTDRIFWFSTIADVVHSSPMARVWRRPRDQNPHSLTEH